MSTRFAGSTLLASGAILGACLLAVVAAATGSSGGLFPMRTDAHACEPSGLCYGAGTTDAESLRHLVGLKQSKGHSSHEETEKGHDEYREMEEEHECCPKKPPPEEPPEIPYPPAGDDDDDDGPPPSPVEDDDDDPPRPIEEEDDDHLNPGLFALFGIIPIFGGFIATLGGLAAATVTAVTSAPPAPPQTGAPAVPPLPPPTLASAAVAAALSNAILAADIEAAAQLLIDSDDITGLVQGLQIPKAAPVGPSADRNTDGDVVAVKAIALAVLSSQGLENKLTTVTFQSVILPSVADGTGLTLDSATLLNDILESLSDPAFLNEILQADANETLRRFSRRLACVDCTDSASWVCNFCWPADFCIDFWFCKPVLEGNEAP